MSRRALSKRFCPPLILAGALLPACVPPVEETILSAPCPCPSPGYKCCEDKCIPEDAACNGGDVTADTGTGTEGTSYGSSLCSENRDCNGGEICVSWRDTDGAIKGPRRCRPPCYNSDPCTGNQVCELTLSNGRSIDDYQLALACIESR
jgi:hypothetical protein